MKLLPGISWNQLKKKEESFFHQTLLGRDAVHNGRQLVRSPGQHPITSHALRHHLNSGSFSILTAHNPGAERLSPEENAQRNHALEAELKSRGAIYHKVRGQYSGNHEESFMVHHTRSVGPDVINEMAARHGQESVLHSSKGHHRLQYVTGPNAGKHHPGRGYSMNHKAKDNFSAPANKPKDKFSAEIDFNTITKADHAKRLDSIQIETEDGMAEVVFDTDRDSLHDGE